MKSLYCQFALALFFFSFHINACNSLKENEFNKFTTENQNDFSLYVSLGNKYKFKSQNYLEELKTVDPTFKKLSLEYGFTLIKGISIDEETLLRMEKSAAELTGSASNVSKLRQIFKVVFTNGADNKTNELAEKLRQISIIEYCSLVSNLPEIPPSDILPETPNLESRQGYIESNPGLNVRFAWNMNVNGSGVKARDIEYGFNKDHEELNDKNVHVASGMTIGSEASSLYTDHGTYALGIIYGDKGSYGISGLAHNADEVLLVPEWQESGYDRVFAVSEAIARSNAGDILIYEMQTQGQNSQYVPAEFNAVIWDLTKAATDSGLVVVAAAGNGSQNLDAVYYQEYNNRGDSGAIIIGAGNPDLNHDRRSNSTYGSRVNVQGWGTAVYTSGYYYGSATLYGNDINQGYGDFNSTSAATAIVGACVIVLQSYYKSMTGSNLTSQQLRTIMIDSGIPQGVASSSLHIGPLPNMETAINEINTVYLSTTEYGSNWATVYPNPSKKIININILNSAIGSKANLYSIDGKIIMKNISLDTQSSIDIESLERGVYLLELTFANNKKTCKKIVKE